MNAPLRFELVVLPEGAKKYVDLSTSLLISCRVAITKETKLTNAASFNILLEDHTLGNIVRMYDVGIRPLVLTSR